MKTPVASIMACVLLALAGSAHAQNSQLRFSGYGTLGAVVTDTDDVELRANVRQNMGATKSADIGVDSRLGLQADYRFDDNFSAVAQVLMSRRDGREQGQLEWLVLQAKLSASVEARAGRMVLPLYLLSDSRNVGYSQSALRAPAEVYIGYPATSFDGAQLAWRPKTGDVNWNIQGSAGSTKATVYMPVGKAKFDGQRLRSLSVSADVGNWTYRAGMVDTRLDFLGIRFDRDRFSTVGVQYDDGTWQLASEYGGRRMSNGFGDSDAAYVMGGRRFGTWMPYAYYGKFKGIGPAYAQTPRGDTKAAGLRWDLHSGFALKAQYENTRPVDQIFTEAPYSKRLNALSIALDFVF